MWTWDAFVCHAGVDKPFATLLHKRLGLHGLGLRVFLDKPSLVIGDIGPKALEAAVKTTQVAVVLLSEEFFQKEWPQHELRWFLQHHLAGRGILVPVFLSVTWERCMDLASAADLAAVCDINGIPHAGERDQATGNLVTHGATMDRIVQAVRDITGV